MSQVPERQSEEQKAKDFFISYTQKDSQWAQWIALELERGGYTTIIQAWDSRPGMNFVHMMNEALDKSKRTIVVLSEAYLQSKFGFVEWAATFRTDPTGEKGLVIPVRIEECQVRGLLGPIVSIDLIGLNKEKAREVLLAGVQAGRAKPSNVDFPAARLILQTSAFGGPFPVLWNVPRRPSLFFTGRDAVLEEIAAGFQRHTTVGMPPYQALVGLGGMGKTQTAAEYAYRWRTSYKAVFWISAETSETLTSGFSMVARLLQLPEMKSPDQKEAVEAVRHWLHTSSEWLLILDNAEDLLQVASFLPTAAPGHVLLTTRAQATIQLAQPVILHELSPDDGALFILRRAGYLLQYEQLDHAKPVSLKAALELSHAMKGLPLALEQAGAYIEDTGRSVRSYLEFYQQEHTRLQLQRIHSGPVPDYPDPVASAWQMSWKLVQQRDSVAANLLRLCAFLAPEAIDEQIVKGVASVLGVPTTESPDRIELELDSTLTLLRRTSLLQREVDRETDVQRLTMHRIIQQVLRDEMDEPTQQQWAEHAVKAVAHALPLVERQLLQVQLRQCTQLIRRWKMTFWEADEIRRALGERKEDDDTLIR